MEQVLAVVGRFVERDRAQDLLEYALLVGLIALVAFVAVTTVGKTISTTFWGYIASVPL